MAAGQANGKQPGPVGGHIRRQELGDPGARVDGLHGQIFQGLHRGGVPQLAEGLLRHVAIAPVGQERLGAAGNELLQHFGAESLFGKGPLALLPVRRGKTP